MRQPNGNFEVSFQLKLPLFILSRNFLHPIIDANLCIIYTNHLAGVFHVFASKRWLRILIRKATSFVRERSMELNFVNIFSLNHVTDTIILLALFTIKINQQRCLD